MRLAVPVLEPLLGAMAGVTLERFKLCWQVRAKCALCTKLLVYSVKVFSRLIACQAQLLLISGRGRSNSLPKFKLSAHKQGSV